MAVCCSLSLLRFSRLARLILYGRGFLDEGGPPSESRSVYRHLSIHECVFGTSDPCVVDHVHPRETRTLTARAIVLPHRERENRESNWLVFTQDVRKVSTYEVNWLVVLWKILRYEELPRGYRGRFEINSFSRINLIPFISRVQSREGWVSQIERRSPRVLHMYIHISWQVVDNENGTNFFVTLGGCSYVWGN